MNPEQELDSGSLATSVQKINAMFNEYIKETFTKMICLNKGGGKPDKPKYHIRGNTNRIRTQGELLQTCYWLNNSSRGPRNGLYVDEKATASRMRNSQADSPEKKIFRSNLKSSSS